MSCRHPQVVALENSSGTEARLYCYYCNLGFMMHPKQIPESQSARWSLLSDYEAERDRQRMAELASRDLEQAAAILRGAVARNYEAARKAFRLGQ